jgi:hypothetical protein
MVDQAGSLDTLYRHWVAAEARYARALATFSGDGPPAVVLKDSALQLAEARNRADSARDKFFKRALT